MKKVIYNLYYCLYSLTLKVLNVKTGKWLYNIPYHLAQFTITDCYLSS